MASITATATLKSKITATATLKAKITATAILKVTVSGIPNDCPTLLSELSTTQLNECILPNYDFTDAAVTDDLTAQQQTDLDNFINPPAIPLVNTLSTAFDGVDDYINIDPVLTALATTIKGTWSYWVKPAAGVPLAVETHIHFGDTDASYTLSMTHRTGDGDLDILAHVNGVNQWELRTLAPPFTSGVWTHVVLTHDGLSPRLYIDSVDVTNLTDTDDTSVWFNDIPLLDNGRIGQQAFANFNIRYFTGNMDEVRFWDIDLRPDEVVTHYNSGTPLPLLSEPLQSNLITSYRMGDNDTFSTITDNAGSNDGTMVNMEAGDFVTDTP